MWLLIDVYNILGSPLRLWLQGSILPVGGENFILNSEELGRPDSRDLNFNLYNNIEPGIFLVLGSV